MITSEGIRFYKFNKDTNVDLKDGYSLCQGRTIKDWLEHVYKHYFNTDNLLREGVYLLAGYRFILTDHLTRYIHTNNGRVCSAYAPSVKALREARCLSRNEKVAKAPKGF